RPKSWQSEYRSLYHREPHKLPSDEDAVDFIIKTVKEHPNEVTIAAIGPCTNIAKAVLRAPEIVPLIKRIVYMAGVFFQEGNVTHTAEFNCWFDPEAAKISFRTPFNEQIIVPLDVCEKVRFTEKRFEKAEKIIKTPVLREMMDRDFRKTMFKEKRESESFIWDLLAAAIIVDPTIITEEVTLPVDVNDTFSLSYGQAVVFKGGAPQGTQKARIILSVDEKKLWNLLFDAFRKM
ncbi:MAG: nucleoside hydrolase, partial [Synergistes sp.]|nr:nucleoside hydrolase [Synergistes sp.]